MTNYPEPPKPVELTEAAAKKAIEAMSDEGLDGYGLRIGMQGGGCAGLQYLLDFHDLTLDPSENDIIYDRYGVTIVVDCFSATYLMGTTLNYVDGLMNSGFKFENPNIVRTCGCGSSVGY